jgi:hypothetical protein
MFCWGCLGLCGRRRHERIYMTCMKKSTTSTVNVGIFNDMPMAND